MFLLNVISEAVRTCSWQRIQEQAHSLLPYHVSFESDVERRPLSLRCTIKRNQVGDEIMAASTRMNNIKSRFVFFLEKKQRCVDFPRKNIRAWIGEFGNIVLRPLSKEKPYMQCLEKGYKKLAELHAILYLEVFKKNLGF